MGFTSGLSGLEQQTKPTRFLKTIFNLCYLESYYLAEIIISTGVPNPLEKFLQGAGDEEGHERCAAKRVEGTGCES